MHWIAGRGNQDVSTSAEDKNTSSTSSPLQSQSFRRNVCHLSIPNKLHNLSKRLKKCRKRQKKNKQKANQPATRSILWSRWAPSAMCECANLVPCVSGQIFARRRVDVVYTFYWQVIKSKLTETRLSACVRLNAEKEREEKRRPNWISIASIICRRRAKKRGKEYFFLNSRLNSTRIW